MKFFLTVTAAFLVMGSFFAPKTFGQSAQEDTLLAWGGRWEENVYPKNRPPGQGASRTPSRGEQTLTIQGGMAPPEPSIPARFSDPEGGGYPSEPIQGAPIFTYRPEPLRVLQDPTLSAPTPPLSDFETPKTDPWKGDRLAMALWRTLRDGRPTLTTLASHVPQIVSFYAARGFKPIWIEPHDSEGSLPTTLPCGISTANSSSCTPLKKWQTVLRGSLTPQAQSVLDVLKDAQKEGLDPRMYRLFSLEKGPSRLGKEDILAQLDLEMTAAALRYAQHASGGIVLPNKISGYHDLSPPIVPLDDALATFASGQDIGAYLTSLHPQHPAYGAFKAALGDALSKEETVRGSLPSKAIFIVGKEGEYTVLLRQKLFDRGFFKGEIGQDPIFSKKDQDALKTFQASIGLKRTGQMTPKTRRALNRENPNLVTLIRLNMERLRWFPREFPDRYVWVNQASFLLSLMDHGAPIFQTRVIVGAKNTQTFLFQDVLQTVEFNPYWGVPSSIVRHEMLALARKNPFYFDRNGFEVLDLKGKKIASSSVSWHDIGRTIPFYVRQKPGRGNALGEVKFLFPNAHAIYMHDTPTRSLFSRKIRAFSHGCIRVQNPRDFAAALLDLSENDIVAHIRGGRNHSVKVSPGIEVFLTYFTLWPDGDNFSTFSDIYGRDALLQKALDKTAALYGGV